MKTAAPRVRRMWALKSEVDNPPEFDPVEFSRSRWFKPGSHKNHPEIDVPYIVIPDDPASREALVERMARAILKAWQDGDGYVNSLDEARAALAAIRK